MNGRNLARFAAALTVALLLCGCASSSKRIDCEKRLEPINSPVAAPSPPDQVQP